MVTTTTTDNALIRPDHGYGFYEVPVALIDKARSEVLLQAQLMAAGVDDRLTPCQQLVFYILKDSGALTP